MAKLKLFGPIRLAFKELKLVEWLSFRKVIESTILVLAISSLVGIIIIAFDSSLFYIRNILLG